MTSVGTYVGTIRADVGSAAQDIQNHLQTLSSVGTMHCCEVLDIGDGKYFQGYTIYE